MASKVSWQQLLFFLLFCGANLSTISYAEITEERHIHHFYNARLLNPGEHQISIVGNYKYGINEDVELGTQGLLTIGAILNFYVKHKMFDTPNWTTSFVLHVLRGQTQQPSGLGVDDGEESSETESVLLYGAAAGVITTYRLAPGSYLNYGIYDYMVRQTVDSNHQLTKIHVFTPAIGYDRYLSPSWALTALIAYPVWLTGQVQSDVADIEINLNLLTGLPPSLNPSLGFLTATHSWETLNIEGGLMFISQTPSLYANLFWRFF